MESPPTPLETNGMLMKIGRVSQRGRRQTSSFATIFQGARAVSFKEINIWLFKHTLPETNKSPLKIGRPKRKGLSSNHHFSAAMLKFGVYGFWSNQSCWSIPIILDSNHPFSAAKMFSFLEVMWPTIPGFNLLVDNRCPDLPQKKWGQLLQEYCWWKKSCTSWHDKYPVIYRVSYMSGGSLVFLSINCTTFFGYESPIQKSFVFIFHHLWPLSSEFLRGT